MAPPVEMVQVGAAVFHVHVANRAVVTSGTFSVISVFVMNSFLKVMLVQKLAMAKVSIQWMVIRY